MVNTDELLDFRTQISSTWLDTRLCYFSNIMVVIMIYLFILDDSLVSYYEDRTTTV